MKRTYIELKKLAVRDLSDFLEIEEDTIIGVIERLAEVFEVELETQVKLVKELKEQYKIEEPEAKVKCEIFTSAEAAKILGITPQQLRKRLRSSGIEKDEKGKYKLTNEIIDSLQ